jgi:hypothetical protein
MWREHANPSTPAQTCKVCHKTTGRTLKPAQYCTEARAQALLQHGGNERLSQDAATMTAILRVLNSQRTRSTPHAVGRNRTWPQASSHSFEATCTAEHRHQLKTAFQALLHVANVLVTKPLGKQRPDGSRHIYAVRTPCDGSLITCACGQGTPKLARQRLRLHNRHFPCSVCQNKENEVVLNQINHCNTLQ